MCLLICPRNDNLHLKCDNATQTKDRLYAQLATSLKNMSRAVGKTADLFEQLQVDLGAMRTLAGIHAAQFMVVAAEINADGERTTEEPRAS